MMIPYKDIRWWLANRRALETDPSKTPLFAECTDELVHGVQAHQGDIVNTKCGRTRRFVMPLRYLQPPIDNVCPDCALLDHVSAYERVRAATRR